MSRSRRFKEIESALYESNLYCTNPEEILTSDEWLDSQRGSDSYELDFDEQLENDLEIDEQKEEYMTDFEQWQANNFETYYAKLLQTKTHKEYCELVKEVVKESAACAPDYFFNYQDSQTFWTKSNDLKLAFHKQFAQQKAEERKNKDQKIVEETMKQLMEKIEKAKGDIRKLEDARLAIYSDRVLYRDEKLPLYGIIKEQLDSIKKVG